ncbi:ankyrin repeat-containing domain protein [Dendryphion nanum]|uniref:Ankyrin repeat-containing domain protein n=1 Tax=Dendryphion nanum TaxID=256645 RepID=A0A9P9CZ36_9PLEO|nr:ankyrin repeat-containing domain protein [Dendryphion nanum]
MDVWERYKPTLKHYWIVQNMRLEEVAKTMKDEHNFDRSSKTFEAQFRKWGVEFSKKQKATLWKTIGGKVKKRTDIGKESTVRIYGKVVPKDKLQKEISRYHFPSMEEQYGSAPSPMTPEGVIIETPKHLNDLSYHFENLPWLRFQDALKDFFNSKARALAGKYSHKLTLTYPHSQATIPYPVDDMMPWLVDDRLKPTIEMFCTAIYMISNNMAVLSSSFIHLLGHKSNKDVLNFILSTDIATVKAFKNDLFRAATENEEEELLNRLVLNGADATGANGSRALIFAIQRKNKLLIRLLINAGVKVDKESSYINILSRGDLRSPIHEAVQSHDIELVRMLIVAGANVNQTFDRLPVIFTALSIRRTDILSLLIKAGADVNVASDEAELCTPLQAAARVGNLPLVRLFLIKGADVNGSPMVVPGALAIAAKDQFTEGVHILLNSGAEVNPQQRREKDQHHYGSALHEAVQGGHAEIVRFLLQEGADPNVGYDSTPETYLERPTHRSFLWKKPLFIATGSEDVKIAQLLIAAKADINASGMQFYMKLPAPESGQPDSKFTCAGTALHNAILKSNKTIVELLLSAGASTHVPVSMFDPVTETWRSISTGQFAVECGDTQITELIHASESLVHPTASETVFLAFTDHLDDLDTNSDNSGELVNVVPKSLWRGTELQEAVRQRNKEIVANLIADGVDVNAPGDGTCGTALREAVRTQQYDTVVLLINAGADVNTSELASRGVTNLQEAIRRKQHDIAKLLINVGAYVNAAGGDSCGTALQEATRLQDITLIQQLILAGADVNADGSGFLARNAFQEAIAARNLLIARILLDAGADINGRSSSGATSLHLASESGHSEVLEFLIENGAEINARTKFDPETALKTAVRAGHAEIVDLLLRAGADPNYSSPRYNNKTALHDAVLFENVRIVKLLLDNGADTNAFMYRFYPSKDSFSGETPLLSAIDRDNYEICNLLLDAGACTDLLLPSDEDGRTALGAIMSRPSLCFSNDEHRKLAARIMSLAPDLDAVFKCYAPIQSPDRDKSLVTPLGAAVWLGALDLVEFLVEAGVNVDEGYTNIDEPCFWTRISPLEVAVGKKMTPSSVDIVRCLLNAGADCKSISYFPSVNIELGNNYRDVSLLAACVFQSKGNYDIFDLLIEAGVPIDVPAKERGGRTALQVAAEIGDLVLVERLLALGADPNAAVSHDSGATALQLAAIGGYAGIAMVLLEHGADPDAEGAVWQGRTALEGAAEHGRLDLVQLILNANETRGVSSQTYETALDLAEKEGHTVVAELIRHHMWTSNVL